MSDQVQQISEAPQVGVVASVDSNEKVAPIIDDQKDDNAGSKNPMPITHRKGVELTRNFEQLTTSLAFAQLLGINQPDELIGSGTTVNAPVQQDVTISRAYPRGLRQTHWIRFDPYTVFQRWVSREGHGDVARTVSAERFVDRVVISSPVLPIMTVSSTWLAAAQTSLLQDPQSAKSTVISATSSNPGFAAYIVENVNGRLVLDETIWFFRMLCLLQCIEDVIGTESYILFQEFVGVSTAIDDTGPGFPRMLRLRVPTANAPNIPVYYANSNQFALFTRNQAPFVRGRISVQHLGTSVAVVPIMSQDCGKFLIHLIASSMGSSLWNTWLGNFVVGHVVAAPDGGSELNVVQFFETKGAKLQIPGPLRAVVLVVWDDAGPANWTTPREFGIGQAVPCLLAPEQGGGPDINFARIFYEYYGIAFGDNGDDPGMQGLDIGSTWMEAYTYLQRNYSYGNAERRAIAAAAELFFDAMLPVSLCDGVPPPDPNAVIDQQPCQHDYAGATFGMSAIERRRHANARLAQPPPPPPVEAAPAADRRWDLGDTRNAGRPTFCAPGGLTGEEGLRTGYFTEMPHVVAQKGGIIIDTLDGDINGNFNCEPYWEQELLRVSPNGFLRAASARTTEVVALNDFYNYRGVPADGQRDILITTSASSGGISRMKLPTSNWLTRLACAMGAVEVTGSTLNWKDPAAANYYIRNVAHTLGAAYNTLLMASGLSTSCWLGVADPNQRFRTIEYVGQKYDLFRATTFGSAVPNQSQLDGSAAVRAIRRFPRYLRYDEVLGRNINLWMAWEEVAHVMNKFCSDAGKALMPLNVHSLKWDYFQYNGQVHMGWCTSDVVVETADMNLASNNTRVVDDETTVRCTNMVNTLVVNEYPPLSFSLQCSRFLNGMYPVGDVYPRTLCWCVPQVEIDNGNMAIFVALDRPTLLEADGRVGIVAVWPDPVFWNWLAQRAISIGSKLVLGNWLGALVDTVQYAVRDIAKHITTGKWAWESPDVVVATQGSQVGTHSSHAGMREDQVD